MFEKRYAAVPPVLFTADGTTNGTVMVAGDACSAFKVKQEILISALSLPTLTLEVKEITDDNTILVGIKGAITLRFDISAYTLMGAASISANEQKRPAIDFAELQRAMYEEEPTVAQRSVLVDECGNRINNNNPLPVAFDGTVSIGDVSIVDNGNTLKVNTDGSINVNIVSSSDTPGLIISYNEITSVAAGIETTVLTVTAPPTGYRIQKIEVSGDNVGQYRVYMNTNVILTKRTWWTDFNATFNFEDFSNGLLLTSGQTISVTITHSSPDLGTFDATAMALAN